MGARLIGLAALVARRYGPMAAARLVRAVHAWLANPANAAARAELEAQLRGWAGRAGGSIADTAVRLMRELDRRRRMSVAAWERELMSLRMDISMASGPAREAALVAYAEEAEAAAAIIASSPRPREALQEVHDTFRAERGMLAGEPLRPGERQRALRALDRALAACRRAAPA
ncbi:MAG: hypothetical protein AB1416_05475 [Actinomycetota bacterium]